MTEEKITTIELDDDVVIKIAELIVLTKLRSPIHINELSSSIEKAKSSTIDPDNDGIDELIYCIGHAVLSDVLTDALEELIRHYKKAHREDESVNSE